MTEKKEPLSLEDRLSRHPKLRARIERLLETVENARGDVEKADEAERRVIEELRRMGQEALQSWAEGQSERKSVELREQSPGARRHVKKNSTGTRPSDQ